MKIFKKRSDVNYLQKLHNYVVKTSSWKDSDDILEVKEFLDKYSSKEFLKNAIVEKRETVYIATYTQDAHYLAPEDDWSDTRRIYGSVEFLFETMKDWFKMSGRTFGDYPLGSIFTPSNITYKKKEVITVNGEKYSGPSKDIRPPDFHYEASRLFNEWEKEVRERLPRLRKLRNERRKREKEFATYQQLKEKYENGRK